MQIFSKFLLLSIFIFGVLSFNALANKQSADFEVINLADDFYTLYQSSKTLTAENRAEQFSQHFTSQFAPFYSDKSFVKAIEGFSGIEEVYFSKNRRLSKELNNFFKRAFYHNIYTSNLNILTASKVI